MASMPPRWGDGIVPSYDLIAEQYAAQYFDELDGKPFDRAVLDRFAATVKDHGRVCDLGCGPGQVARYLAAHGVDAFGIDASAAMVATARRLNPTLQFRQGDFFHLQLADSELAGVAAFYCLIHCARGELGRAVAEIHRVLMPRGRFLLALHVGEGEVGRDEAYASASRWWRRCFPRRRCVRRSPPRDSASTSWSRASRIPSNTRAGESMRRPRGRNLPGLRSARSDPARAHPAHLHQERAQHRRRRIPAPDHVQLGYRPLLQWTVENPGATDQPQ
jgi:SAM-dependent methyltransferase